MNRDGLSSVHLTRSIFFSMSTKCPITQEEEEEEDGGGGFSEGKRASRTFLFVNSAVKLGFAVMGLRGFAVIHEAHCSHAALMRKEEGRLEEQRAAVKVTIINQITFTANRNRKH